MAVTEPTVRFAEADADAEEEEESLDEIEPFVGVDRGLTYEEVMLEEALDGDQIRWKNHNNIKETRATIGVAQTAAWEQAKKEFEFLRAKMEEKTGSRRPRFEAIYKLFLGEKSQLFRVFKEEGIFDCYGDFQQFLATFYLSSSYQVSTKQLFDRFSRINLGGAMPRDQYVAVWKAIGHASLPSIEERNRSVTPVGMKPFWLKIEEATNENCRELFLKDFPGALQTTLDDDKPHCQANRCTAGLKAMRHVKDNVNGHTLHTLVLSYSQTPAQVTWEREVNDSSETATQRIFGNGITPMAATGQPGDLRHVFCAKDRGYWTRNLLHGYVMKSGAKIKAGTVKRQRCIPMTYNQKITGSDTREDVPTAGARTMLIKEAASHGRKLYCIAFRNGHGGVTLGVSTEHGDIPEWELVLARPQDLKWYDDPRLTEDTKLQQSFQVVHPSPTSASLLHTKLEGEFLDEVRSLPVRPLTTTQGSPEWFFMRKFALTSSTTDKAIAVCSGNEEWLANKPSWATVKQILSGIIDIGGEEDDDDEEDAAEEDDDSIVPAGEEGDGAEDTAAAAAEEPPAPPVDNNGVKLTLDGLLASDGMIQAAKHQIQFDEINMDQVKAILSGLGKNPSKASQESKRKSTDLGNFRIFLEADPRLRMHVFKPKKDLIAMAKALGVTGVDDKTTADNARKAIDDHLKSNPEAVVKDTAKAKKKKRVKASEKLDTKDLLLYTVLKASYLEKLEGKAKKYTRRGHLLECHIVRSCLRELRADGDTPTPLKVLTACTAPLVEKTATPFARDSIDFLALASDDGIDVSVIGVEIKARVAHRTDQAAASQVAAIRRLFGQDRTPAQRARKYFAVEADSEQFVKLVNNTHEAIQILHHASVYELEHVLLLVGDNHGSIVYGVFVHVPVNLRVAYCNVLHDIYSNSIRWIYDSNTPKPTDKRLRDIFEFIVVYKAQLDRQSFDMQVALWQDINSNLTMPIPRLRHIIPLVFAFWNTLKGGSDATTNLIWHCQYSVPNNENQSVAVARMLSLAAVHVHRLSQLSTAKDSLDFYASLTNFRTRASDRASFKKTQFMIVDHITKQFIQQDSTPPSTPPPQTAAAAARETRSQAEIDRVQLHIVETNKTPKRGVAARCDQMEEKLESGRLDQLSRFALDRARECVGFPVKRIGVDGEINGKGGRGTCALCSAPTHNFCMHCKRWACDAETVKATQQPGWKAHVVINDEIHVQRTCFYHLHHANQEQALEELAKKAAGIRLQVSEHWMQYSIVGGSLDACVAPTIIDHK